MAFWNSFYALRPGVQAWIGLGGLLGGFLVLWGLGRWGKGLRRRFCGAGLLCALGLIAASTLLRRQGGGTPLLILEPFRILREARVNDELYRSIVLNILLFLPFGITLPVVLPRRLPLWGRGLLTLLAGCLLSACVEALQYVWALGQAELDDLLCNGLGTALGLVPVGLVYLLERRRDRKAAAEAQAALRLEPSEALLLEAFSAGLRGAQVSWEQCSEADWQALFALAEEHKLLPMVLEAVYASPAGAAWAGLGQIRRQSKAMAVSQVLKTAAFLGLYQELLDAGTEPLVVKGLLCRSLYPNPDLRQSGDEDLYVTEADFPRCCQLLRDRGYVPLGPADEDRDFEIGWARPGAPLHIELHRALFSPESGALSPLQAPFADSFSRKRAYDVGQGPALWSMCPQEHLLYLLLHAYKHLIHSGFGLRQVSDIGLWAKVWAEEIDWAWLYDQCQALRTAKFAGAVFAIASEDLGIDLKLPGPWSALQVDRRALRKDLLRAGIYGYSSRSRQHSAPMTLEAVAAQRDSRRRAGLLGRAFPPRQALEGSYPELKEHPARLPLIWAKRLLRYRAETRAQGDNSAAEALRIAKEREAMLREYEIL